LRSWGFTLQGTLGAFLIAQGLFMVLALAAKVSASA
jgi:hypothetical protein